MARERLGLCISDSLLALASSFILQSRLIWLSYLASNHVNQSVTSMPSDHETLCWFCVCVCARARVCACTSLWLPLPAFFLLSLRHTHTCTHSHTHFLNSKTAGHCASNWWYPDKHIQPCVDCLRVVTRMTDKICLFHVFHAGLTLECKINFLLRIGDLSLAKKTK